jgi:hypothetical protein
MKERLLLAAEKWFEWPECRGEFNRSSQHHLIRKDKEVSYGDVADLVYVSAEG